VLAGEEEAQAEQEFDLEFDWASESARLVGTVVHRLLEQVGRQGIDTMQAVDLDRLATIGRRMLVQESLPGEALADAADKVREALESTFGDERGRWILSASHRDVHSEYALTSAIGDEIVHMIIDRTFVDAEGTRWIIDYKTGSHAGGGLDEFLDREQARYRNQLEEYATAMRARDDRPVRLGLYFPLLKSWREWKYEG
jgi:RecB family exonuclease